MRRRGLLDRDFGIIRTLRRLGRRPASPLFAILALALGSVTVLAVTTVVQGVLFRDLPYPEPERLALIWRGTAETPDSRGSLSPGDWLDIRERVDAFSDVAAVNSFSTTLLTDEGVPRQLELGVVTGSFFETIGFRTILGRGIEPDDHRIRLGPDDVGVIVLAHDLWQERFGGDPGIVGRSVRLGGSLHTIVGVLAPESQLLMPSGSGMATDLQGWIPFDIDYVNQPRDGTYLRLLGRLAPEVGIDRANVELDALATRLRAEHPEHADVGLRLRALPLPEEVVAHVRPVLRVLVWTALIVLLVTCANVATLLLVRFMSRRTETAVKAALGAGRLRLVAELIGEAAVVCVSGALLGLVLAGPAVRALIALDPGIVPRAAGIHVGSVALAPALLIGLIATLLSGLGPALIATFDGIASLIRSRGSGHSWVAPWTRRGLLFVQVSASVVLLYGGATLLRSIVEIRSADLGFRAEGVTTARITLPFGSYREPSTWVGFFRDLRTGLSARPEVSAVGLTSDLPTNGVQSLEPWAPVDAPPSETWGARTALHRVVTAGYFDAAGIDVRAGRGIEASDGGDDVPVGVVDRTLAAVLSEDGGQVVGRRIDVTRHTFEGSYEVGRMTVQVVGVVDAVPHEHPSATPPGTVYLPLTQYPLWSMSLVARGTGGAPPTETIRRALATVDPGVPLTEVRSLEEVVDATLATTRFLLGLIIGLAAVVVCLTTAGLFGLVSETVLQRRRELCIRIALGARAGQVVGIILASGLVVVAAGLVPGALVTPWIAGALRQALGHGPVHDPAALGLALLTVAAVAALACYLPARRAGRIQPMTVMKEG